MATCRICGLEQPNLPENWINWQCPLCEADELQGVVGVHTQEEREQIGAPHASIPHTEPQIPRKWTKEWLESELDLKEDDDWD